MRVQVRWADERVGAITDIACFEPLDRRRPRRATERRRPAETSRPGHRRSSRPVALDYLYAASPEESRSTAASPRARSSASAARPASKVYVPPRSACPADGTPTAEEVELPDTGTVTTFCIVNVPFLGQKITPPYVSAYVLLDGADIAFLHLILDIPADEVRMGMRVKAVWKPRDEWGTTIENITTSRRPASRTRTTRPTSSTSERDDR